MKLVYEGTNAPVQDGDTLTDFRGEEATFVGWYPPRHPGSTGRVEVRVGDSPYTSLYYPSVFGVKIVD